MLAGSSTLGPIRVRSHRSTQRPTVMAWAAWKGSWDGDVYNQTARDGNAPFAGGRVTASLNLTIYGRG
jgi:hypothetical protein